MGVCSAELERGILGVLEYLLVASSMVSMRAADPLLGVGNPNPRLTLLNHKTLGAAVWDLQAGPYPMITRAMAVKWILESGAAPPIICYENIDIKCPRLGEGINQDSITTQQGKIILLLAQASPNEDGAYVYVGEGLPLIR